MLPFAYPFLSRKSDTMSVPSTARAIWKSAELLIAFHKNRHQERRDKPYLWRPKDATAWLNQNPKYQEAVVVLKGVGDSEDVQVKIHTDKMVIRRDQPLGWSGIVIDDDVVRVKVDDTWILVKSDGGVTVENDAETTYLDGDGSILKISPDTEIMVSADGERMSRRTEDQFDAFSEAGFMSQKR